MAAGSSLFSVVVSSDQTASQLIELINSHKLPRIDFLPLNRLKVKEFDYPDLANVYPLISALKYAPEIKPAVLKTFGRYLICRDMDLCRQVPPPTN